MTRKHFKAIAEAIAETRQYAETDEERAIIDRTAQRIAYAVGQFNDYFDREKFLRAAGHSRDESDITNQQHSRNYLKM